MPRDKHAKKTARKTAAEKRQKNLAKRRVRTISHATESPAPEAKEGKVRSCVLLTLDKEPPKTGPDSAPKDKWPELHRWDTKANEIAKCIKRKFKSADQVAVKELLLDNHGSARKAIIKKVAGIV